VKNSRPIPARDQTHVTCPADDVKRACNPDRDD
jgi:hypothetical protein